MPSLWPNHIPQGTHTNPISYSVLKHILQPHMCSFSDFLHLAQNDGCLQGEVGEDLSWELWGASQGKSSLFINSTDGPFWFLSVLSPFLAISFEFVTFILFQIGHSVFIVFPSYNCILAQLLEVSFLLRKAATVSTPICDISEVLTNTN